MCYLVVIFLTLFNHEKLKVEANPNNSEDIMKNYLVQRENILKNEQKVCKVVNCKHSNVKKLMNSDFTNCFLIFGIKIPSEIKPPL